MDRELIYVGDPMCSWCWGMSPVIDRLDGLHGLPLRLVVGGLRPGTGAPMDEAARRYIAHHWHQVEARTGQPFDHSLFERDGFVYDTEPACAAVVTMRTLDEGRALPYFARLQRAFYAEGVDVTDHDQLVRLAGEFPVDRARFGELLASEENRARTWEDFREARSMGVTGFPTVLLRMGTRLYPVALGYTPFEQVEQLVGQWMARQAAQG